MNEAPIRKMFEEWMTKTRFYGESPYELSLVFRKHPDGRYKDRTLQYQWEAVEAIAEAILQAKGEGHE
jgi:hypothetical protein